MKLIESQLLLEAKSIKKLSDALNQIGKLYDKTETKVYGRMDITDPNSTNHNTMMV